MAAVQSQSVAQINKKNKRAALEPKVSSQNRIRLSQDQIAFLELEFQKDTNFPTDRLNEVALLIGLPRNKVYKWQWDRNNKQ